MARQRKEEPRKQEVPKSTPDPKPAGGSDKRQRAIDDVAKVLSERVAPPIASGIAALFAKHPTLGRILFNDATSWVALQGLPEKVLGSASFAKFLEDLISRSFRGTSEKLSREPSTVTEEAVRPVRAERDLAGLIEHILTTKLTAENLEELSAFREYLVRDETDLVPVFDALVWQCARRKPAKQNSSRRQKGGKGSGRSESQSTEPATPATLRDFLNLSRERRIALLKTLHRLQSGTDEEAGMTFNDHLLSSKITAEERSRFVSWRGGLDPETFKHNEQFTAALTKFETAAAYIRLTPENRLALIKRPPGTHLWQAPTDAIRGIRRGLQDIQARLRAS